MDIPAFWSPHKKALTGFLLAQKDVSFIVHRDGRDSFGKLCLYVNSFPYCNIFLYFIMSNSTALGYWSCSFSLNESQACYGAVCVISALQSTGKQQQIAQSPFSMKSHVCVKEMKTKILMSSFKQKRPSVAANGNKTPSIVY